MHRSYFRNELGRGDGDGDGAAVAAMNQDVIERTLLPFIFERTDERTKHGRPTAAATARRPPALGDGVRWFARRG